MKLLLALFVCALAAMLFCGCASNHYYYPTADIIQTPANHNLRYEEITFSSKDGTRLNGWFIPADGDAIGTVIHMHGNAQNISTHISRVYWLPTEGFNVFLFDYRGFGKSEGLLSPRGVHQDCIAAIGYVKARKDVDNSKLIVFGQSLGGACAIAAVGAIRGSGIRAVVSESAFSSYRRVVRDTIGKWESWSFLKWPISFLIVNNWYSPDKVVGKIAPAHLLIIHGTDDPGIDIYHAKRLYRKAREPKELWIIEGGKHQDSFTKYGAEFRPMLAEYLKRVLVKQ